MASHEPGHSAVSRLGPSSSISPASRRAWRPMARRRRCDRRAKIRGRRSTTLTQPERGSLYQRLHSYPVGTSSETGLGTHGTKVHIPSGSAGDMLLGFHAVVAVRTKRIRKPSPSVRGTGSQETSLKAVRATSFAGGRRLVPSAETVDQAPDARALVLANLPGAPRNLPPDHRHRSKRSKPYDRSVFAPIQTPTREGPEEEALDLVPRPE